MDIEDIKKRIYKDENGINNYVDVSIEEMDWLVEQVEKQQGLCFMCGKSKTKNVCLCTDEDWIDEQY